MELMPLRSYRLEFAKRAEWRRDEEERRHHAERARLAREKEEKHEREMDAQEDALMDMVVAVLATNAEIADFTTQLDTYDVATVEALMQNEEQLKQVREELCILLDKAYVLPDGRRVFKTEDGTRVFDEHGQEVNDIDPYTIEDWRPHWEKYQNPFERETTLVEERDNLLEFQKLADEARAETRKAEKDGGMSRERLDELEKKLADEAPDAVKRQMKTDNDAAIDNGVDNDPQPTSFRPAAKLDIPAL